MNTDAPTLTSFGAERRVREIQTKLHRWATDDSDRQFRDLFNLVCDPAFLLIAWERVRDNRGARSAGGDGKSAYYIERQGVGEFLAEVRNDFESAAVSPLTSPRTDDSESGRKETAPSRYSHRA
ncbi:hypothetical protein ACWGI9_45340 [Streptomyces sp. NPDC054833]